LANHDLIYDGGELAAVQAGAEDLGNLVGGGSPEAEFTTSLEQHHGFEHATAPRSWRSSATSPQSHAPSRHPGF
jgi:hypothetical protein